MIPDKIYIGTVTLSSNAPSEEHLLSDWHLKPNTKVANVEYIRKDVLMEWIKSEMERLWELLPDADNPNPTQMELRYLGQYMQMESLESFLETL